MSDIFWREIVLEMNNKLNGHTGDYIKRQAKKIKKQDGLTYLEALEKASINAGFNNWKHFINTDKTISERETAVNSSQPGLPQIAQATSQKSFNPFRNLLVSAVNVLLDKHLISLDGQSADNEDGHTFVELLGYPSVVIWRSISYDELEISVWWKYNHELHPQANLNGNARENFNSSTPLADKSHYKKFVGVVTSGWLERRTGKYLMGDGGEAILKHYTRRGEKQELEKLPFQKPIGFKSDGKFYS